MKKQTKKKLEQELAAAIETILAKHDSHAISKTKKAIKVSVKSVIKKFNKTTKALAAKKEAVLAKRRSKKKVAVKKKVSTKPAAVKYVRPKNLILSPGPQPEINQTDQSIEGFRTEN
ncbi:hypothetical protein BH11BAC1_BH11BAC1_03430 [soil metagenome]